MPARNVSTVTRTVTVSDLTPSEMASVFASWDSHQQAAFFAAIWAESRDWPGTGWNGQALAIIQCSSVWSRFVIGALAEHLADAGD